MANDDIGYLDKAVLMAALPDRIPVRRSKIDGKKYPLYFSTAWGPWHMNTPAAQELILCGAVLDGVAPPEAVAPVARTEAVVPVVAVVNSEKKRGFLDSFFDDLGEL